MSRGGKRIGSGLKSTWNHSETTVIRVPKTFVYQVMDYARALDAQRVTDSVTQSTELVTKSSALDLISQTRTCLAQLEALLKSDRSVDSVTQPKITVPADVPNRSFQVEVPRLIELSALPTSGATPLPRLEAVAVLEKPITATATTSGTTLTAQTFSSRLGETALLFINAIAHRDTAALKDYLSAIAHLATDEEAKVLFKLCKSHLSKLDEDGWEWFQSLRNSWQWEEEEASAA